MAKNNLTVIVDCRNREIARLWPHETVSEVIERLEKRGKPVRRPLRTITKRR